MDIHININEPVWVRLTPEGKKRYAEYIEALEPLDRAHPSPWYQFQLWNLMNIFGSQTDTGAPQAMFEGNIVYLTREDLTREVAR